VQDKTDEYRLRLAYQVAVLVAEKDGPAVMQAWFQGLNPQLEVLAGFRLDPLPGEDLAGIVEDPADAQLYPTQPPGTVPLSWLTPRQGSTATLSGTFCAVTDIESVAAHAAGRTSLDRTPVRLGRSGRRCAALQPGCDALGE
jgi:hypothetical protein